MTRETEIKLLQATVALGCIVPLTGGALGILHGAGFLNHGGDVTLDSHVRYLSGLLLAIGIGFLSAIPGIEKQSERVSILTAAVVTGGLARLYGIFADGFPDASMTFALVMELGVVPVLWLWQRRIAARCEA